MPPVISVLSLHLQHRGNDASIHVCMLTHLYSCWWTPAALFLYQITLNGSQLAAGLIKLMERREDLLAAVVSFCYLCSCIPSMLFDACHQVEVHLLLLSESRLVVSLCTLWRCFVAKHSSKTECKAVPDTHKQNWMWKLLVIGHASLSCSC